MTTSKVKWDSRYHMYVCQCPQCGKVLASASERELMPEWASCNCDIKKP